MTIYRPVEKESPSQWPKTSRGRKHKKRPGDKLSPSRNWAFGGGD